MMDFGEKDGVAFVTGGSGGLGAAVCVMLAERGADLAFTWRGNKDAADATIAAVQATGRQATAYQLDAIDADAAKHIVDEAAASGLHTFIHAAGPMIPQMHLSRIKPELMRSQMEAEISGFFNVVQPALPALRVAKGSIVVISTAATRRYPIRDGLSPAAKGAVEQIVWGLAAEEGRFGIRANCVGPGMTNAGMAVKLDESGDLTERDYAAATANIPMRTFGTDKDIAEAVCFLASDRAGYISGQHLAVDGGYGV